ncbi:hypothetical protein [Petrachloros mirabilis]
MSTLFAVPIFFLSLLSAGWAAETEPLPYRDLDDPRVLQEAIRVLDEEVKLAAHPQTYVVIDLVANLVLIKSRGVELHRFPISQWSATHLDEITSSYRLKERPPVSRRKVDPSGKDDQSPISLDHMPTDFTLRFSPALAVTIRPSSPGSIWRWVKIQARASWVWIKQMTIILSTGNVPEPNPEIYLAVDIDHAQSLAWAVTDGMPFLIRRAALSAP